MNDGGTPAADARGRLCPLRYRYRPEVMRANEVLRADTCYVIGGLYGNVEALRTILAMKEEEERRLGPVRLVFNGDFNWFDIDAPSFQQLNESVLEHSALQGNVEAELAEPLGENGCGCAYPSYVDQATVDRSNAIMSQLQTTAAHFPGITRRLAQLPMHLTLGVAGQRIGVVHGDPEGLAGWSFAVEAMPAGDASLCAGAAVTPQEQIEGYFRAADVTVFACSHTCLPFLQDFHVDGARRVVINNGAAGMPNFRATTFGVLTRISSRPETPSASLYGVELEGVRIDALPIRYDQRAWCTRFLANWPPGSPAHTSYFGRITAGPDFSPAQALRLGQIG